VSLEGESVSYERGEIRRRRSNGSEDNKNKNEEMRSPDNMLLWK